MSESAAFTYACDRLEEATALDRLEARGTVRIALKGAGLEVRSVTPEQMKVAVQRLLPAELEARGIDDSAAVCDAIASGLDGVTVESAGDTPDAVFSRLGGGA